jgi:hypothetical protein
MKHDTISAMKESNELQWAMCMTNDHINEQNILDETILNDNCIVLCMDKIMVMDENCSGCAKNLMMDEIVLVNDIGHTEVIDHIDTM